MNVFHVHDVDQVLYVTAGEGIIATEAEEITIQFFTGDHADPPRMKLGLSCSSGPRAWPAGLGRIGPGARRGGGR